MTGFDQFLAVFGDITILHVIEFIFAVVFIIIAYRKLKSWLIEKHEQDVKHRAELKEALDGVHQYPKYREQSLEIQKLLTKRIDNSDQQIAELKELFKKIDERLTKMENDTKRRECNKLRDKLIQNYRYYTNLETNPNRTWTKMEANAFWELFKDYEESGGDGYIHSEVEPAMRALTEI